MATFQPHELTCVSRVPGMTAPVTAERAGVLCRDFKLELSPITWLQGCRRHHRVFFLRVIRHLQFSSVLCSPIFSNLWWRGLFFHHGLRLPPASQFSCCIQKLFYFILFFTKECSFLQSNLKTNMVLAERACLVTAGLPYQSLSLPSRVFSLGSSLFLCPSPLLEKELANYSSILAWRIPWTEEPGGLESTGSQRVGRDWATSLHFTSPLWEWGWAGLLSPGPAYLMVS